MSTTTTTTYFSFILHIHAFTRFLLNIKLRFCEMMKWKPKGSLTLFSFCFNIIPYPFLFLNNIFLFLFDGTLNNKKIHLHFKIFNSILGIVWGNFPTLNNSKEVNNWWATAFNTYIEKIKNLFRFEIEIVYLSISIFTLFWGKTDATIKLWKTIKEWFYITIKYLFYTCKCQEAN